jgi:serine/threonine protein kinase
MKKIGNYYINSDPFAKGAFSKLYIGYNKYTKEKTAIKEIIIKKNKSKKYIYRELELHKKLKHPNIVSLYDISCDSKKVYMILEYCKYGDLSNFQNKRPMREIYIQNFVTQLSDGLKYLRDLNISHRDLKPQNLLIKDNTTLKISDFGLAKEYRRNEMDEDLKQTYCGSPMYMSPEILNYNSYDTKSDLWSIGIILFEMITGNPPFKAKNLQHLIQISQIPINLPQIYIDNISEDCHDLLMKLLDINKHSRINWDDFFQHSFLQHNKLLEIENEIISNPLSSVKRPNIFVNYKNNDRIYSLNMKHKIHNRKAHSSYKNEIIPEKYQELTIKSVFKNNGSIADNNPNGFLEIYTENSDDSEESSEDDSDNEDLFLSASSVGENIEKINKGHIVSTNANLNSDKDCEKRNDENDENDENKKYKNNFVDSSSSSVNSNDSFIMINNLSFTSSLESSSYKKGRKSNLNNSQSYKGPVSKPIDISNNNKSRKYDFHNEVNLVDLPNKYRENSSSLGSLKNNKSENVKNFFHGSFQLLKESYKYLSNNNHSI